MKRMLFNATHPEETRVGIVDGQKLVDIDIETAGREARKSNIYMGVVTRVEPSLEACFIDYGEDRHGFLPFKEISRAYFAEGVDVRTASIKEAIHEGQELIVQVEKEERGTKGAALTTFISLAGRYLVLMPNNPRAGGVSRRIEGEERQELREAMDKLDLPRGMSTIARTAGIGRTTEELQWDLNYLLKLWEAISDAAKPQYEHVTDENGRKTKQYSSEETLNGRHGRRMNPAPYLIVEESNLVVRAIRDYFQPEIGEILVDTDEIYEQARQFMAHVMPDMVDRVKRYTDDIPLFSRFQIEQQIETAYSRTVPLPSGGAIVIDHTEALVAVDVNSARATRGSDIEDTAFRTNCEAADEIARQMRLRDLGGLIVIDFIDMADQKNQRAVEQRLKDAIRCDRARVQLAKISRFGLMELSRQRLRPALSEGNHVTCPRCNGVGVIRDTESCAIQVLRILQEEAMKEGTGCVQAQVPVDVATFLLNEKRNEITKLEARHRVPIMLIPNTSLETPHYHIDRIRQDDERLDSTVPSFNRVEEIETKADDPYAQKSNEEKPLRPKQVPVIKNIIERDPAPVHQTSVKTQTRVESSTPASRTKQLTPVTPQRSLFRRIIDFLFGRSEKTAEPVKTATPIKTPKTTTERADRTERTSRTGRTDDRRRARGDRTERTDRTERSERRTRVGRTRVEHGEHVERTERSERVERTERAETHRRTRTDRPVREDRRRSRRVEEAQATDETLTSVTTKAVAPVETSSNASTETFVVAPVTTPVEVTDEERRSRRRRSRRRSTDEATQAPQTEVATTETPVDVAVETTAEAPVVAEVKATEAPTESTETPLDTTEDDATRRRRPRRRRRSGRATEENIAAEVSQETSTADVVTESAWQPAEEPLVQIETKSAVSQAVEEIFTVAAEEKPTEHRRPRRSRKPRQETVAETTTEQIAPVVVSAETTEVPAEVKTEEAIPVEEKLIQIETKPQVTPSTEEVQIAQTVATTPVATVDASEVPEALETTDTVKTPEEAPLEQIETVSAAVVKEVATPQVDAITVGLEEALAKAGLVQVHTAQPSAATGYEPVIQPGRKIERREDAAENAPLVQVHTRPELIAPVSYAPVVQPGRKIESRASEADAEPLVQVETKKE